MTSDALKDHLQRKPFRAFGLRMPDGRLLPVPHPEFVSLDPNEERTVLVWKKNGGHWMMDLERVSDLESLEGKNGKRRR